MIEEREAQLYRTPSISSCGTEVGKKELERHNHGGNCDDDYLDIEGHHHRSQKITFFGIKEGGGAAAATEAINNSETESSVNLHYQKSLLLPIKGGGELAKGGVFIGTNQPTNQPTHPPKAIPQSQRLYVLQDSTPESQLNSLQNPPKLLPFATHTHTHSLPHSRSLNPNSQTTKTTLTRSDRLESPKAVAKAKAQAGNS